MPVWVSGVEDKQTHIITAKSITIIESGSLAHISGLGLADRAPALSRDGMGWHGTVYADGYELAVTPKTKTSLPPGTTNPNAWNPNLWIAYKADRQPDGSLLGTQLNFIVDGNVADEQDFRNTNDFKIELPDYDKKQPGKVHFFLQNYRILPDRKLQDAINAFGQKLVPAWQRELPDSDPAKIHFRFFVLEKSKNLDRTLSNDAGTVLIPSQLITKLQNEAQLACLLSADIVGALRKDVYRSRTHKHVQEVTEIAAFPAVGILGDVAINSAFSAGYWTPLREHEYLVGLRYVVTAGYDPREAPIALQRISERHPNSTADKPLPSFANYVDAELGFDYMTTDFTPLRKGESEFAALRNMTLAADPRLKKTEKSRLSD
ncbi:MAG TPA: hypothetical protein VMA71_02780 [Alloacidobacterium sp.]|nr:hypothetical protein [Alloacidobacterium sp.]